MSYDAKWVVASGGESGPRVFRNAKVRAVDAPTVALKSGGAGCRFYYLDRFLLAPSTTGPDLDMYALNLDEDRTEPGDGRAKKIHAFAHGDAKRVEAVATLDGAYSPLIVTAASDRSLRVLDAATGDVARVIENSHSRPPHAVAVPGTSSTTTGVSQKAYDIFASAAVDGVVALWDLRGDAVAAKFSQHVNRRDKIGVAFSPCTRYLDCGSEDKAAYIYDLRSAGAPLAKLRGARDTVAAVAFNPKFPQVATASYDGGLRFYTCA